jgi:hypothetical protein
VSVAVHSCGEEQTAVPASESCPRRSGSGFGRSAHRDGFDPRTELSLTRKRQKCQVFQVCPVLFITANFHIHQLLYFIMRELTWFD